MGMYDYLGANVKCAECGHVNDLHGYEIQTKELECLLQIYVEGSSTPYHEPEDDDESDEARMKFGNYEIIEPSTLDYKCEKCSSFMEVIAIIRRNRIARILDGRILHQETIE